MKPSDIHDASNLLKQHKTLIEDLKRVKKEVKHREEQNQKKTLSFEAKLTEIGQTISLPAEAVFDAVKVTLRAQRNRLITLGVDEEYLTDIEGL